MREKQIHREVRWALWLTLFYIAGWAACAYLLPTTTGFIGFPLWFEMACLVVPLLLIIFVVIVVKYRFEEIDLEDKSE